MTAIWAFILAVLFLEDAKEERVRGFPYTTDWPVPPFSTTSTKRILREKFSYLISSIFFWDNSSTFLADKITIFVFFQVMILVTAIFANMHLIGLVNNGRLVSSR
jgi:hypothetical protein